jgi:hypothetical protein
MASAHFESPDTSLEWREDVRKAVHANDWPLFASLMEGRDPALLLSTPVDRFTFWFEQGDKVLHEAAKFGHAEFVQKLITEMHMPVDLTTVNGGITPLHVAGESGATAGGLWFP